MKHLSVVAALILSSLATRAELFTFYAITSNDSSGHAQFVGESQFYMDETLLEMGQYASDNPSPKHGINPDDTLHLL